MPKTILIPIPISKSSAPRFRNSVEGLNQEIERITIKDAPEKEETIVVSNLTLRGLVRGRTGTAGQGLSCYCDLIRPCARSSATGRPRWAPRTPARPPAAQQQHPQYRHADAVGGRPERQPQQLQQPPRLHLALLPHRPQ